MEKQCSLSVEDYLKAFLENEVKPLWPKGWMQSRSVFYLFMRHCSCAEIFFIHIDGDKRIIKFCVDQLSMFTAKHTDGSFFTDDPHFPMKTFPLKTKISNIALVVFNPEKLTLHVSYCCIAQDFVQGESHCSQSPHWKLVSIYFISNSSCFLNKTNNSGIFLRLSLVAKCK